MQSKQKFDALRSKIKSLLSDESTGHDFYHAERVACLAKQIAFKENANGLICEVAGWVHDINRPVEKETGESHWGPKAIKRIRIVLEELKFEGKLIEAVLTCVSEHEQYSFLGHQTPDTLESRILQDADRLDAIGAIGVARVFMFAGAFGDPMWIPEDDIDEWSPDQHSKSAINHFHEKLFKLVDEMNTETGKLIARKRKGVMEKFIDDFVTEWNGDIDE